MRLIDADALRDEIQVDKYGHIDTTITKLNIAIEHSKIDAVSVVRCYECKHNPKKEWVGCPMANLNERQRPEDAWCWKGER